MMNFFNPPPTPDELLLESFLRNTPALQVTPLTSTGDLTAEQLLFVFKRIAPIRQAAIGPDHGPCDCPECKGVEGN
jgi:hypothetical protein